jgi:hypothetical protein
MNLWMGSPTSSGPKQITFFPAQNILDFAISPDGKKAALVRGVFETDVVLFTDETR